MKIVFFVHTPAQCHLWYDIGHQLVENNHEVLIIARNTKDIMKLLESYDLPFKTYGTIAKQSYAKIAQLPNHLINSYFLIKPFKPDFIAGTGPIEAFLSFILRKPCLIFEDTEPTPKLERAFWKLFAEAIITPSCFLKDLGKKQIRVPSFKELAYLHPNRFYPDPSILNELKIEQNQKYIVLRFNAFDAVHDVGRKGFSLLDKRELVSELSKHARVFISSESPLPEDLRPYKLATHSARIHQVLYYAQLLVCDTGTMAWEAAVLGTAAIACGSFTSQFGNFKELEEKYGLLFAFSEPALAIAKAITLIEEPNLKDNWQNKRRNLLNDKIDLTVFLVGLIKGWPGTLQKLKETRG